MCRSVAEGGRRCNGTRSAVRSAPTVTAAPWHQVHLYLTTDGAGTVRGVSVVGMSMTPQLRAWRDELQSHADAGTFDESAIPETIHGAWVVPVKG